MGLAGLSADHLMPFGESCKKIRTANQNCIKDNYRV
jgi:hypothetical protein